MWQVLKMMDWGEADGGDGTVIGSARPGASEEEEEGVVRFGGVGAEHLAADDDVVLVIAPQNMVGASIYEPLKARAYCPDPPANKHADIW